MNQQESNDWRAIAHDEYELRKHMELQLGKTQLQVADLNKSLDATNNYNSILIKKISELENTSTIQAGKLQRSIELLKNAKLLFAKHKQEVLSLEEANQNLKNELIKKSALLDAEKMQHERTSSQLAQALNKLATAVAMSTFSLPAPKEDKASTAPDIIYAEAAETHQDQTHDKSFIKKLFGHKEVQNKDNESEEDDSDFYEQVILFEKNLQK